MQVIVYISHMCISHSIYIYSIYISYVCVYKQKLTHTITYITYTKYGRGIQCVVWPHHVMGIW